jgi:hypothetical protein
LHLLNEVDVIHVSLMRQRRQSFFPFTHWFSWRAGICGRRDGANNAVCVTTLMTPFTMIGTGQHFVTK